MNPKKIKGERDYHALLCDCGIGKNRYLICGVYASRKEAKEANKEIENCVAKHIIRKCKVEIILNPKQTSYIKKA